MRCVNLQGTVYDLDKGFIGWKEAGKETEK